MDLGFLGSRGGCFLVRNATKWQKACVSHPGWELQPRLWEPISLVAVC